MDAGASPDYKVMADKTDYIEVEITIPAKDFIKETDKAYCFKLWGKKFLAIPKSQVKNVGRSDGTWIMDAPKWFIDKHSLRSLVGEDNKHLFPTKTELKQQAVEQYVPPLFKSKEVVAARNTPVSQDAFPSEFRDNPRPPQPQKQFEGTVISSDEDLGFD